jgi:uncharacterized protein
MNSRINGLVVKIAERCNLNCTYCYMYNHADQRFRTRPAFMSREVFRALADRISAYYDAHEGHALGLAFHGGEPMLFDPCKLDEWLTEVAPLVGGKVRYTVQTNATLVSDEWIALIKKHGIRTSVSLDGPPEVHDEFRVDHSGQGSHARVVEGLRKLLDAGLDTNVLCVINPRQSGIEAYRHLRSLGIRRMNFLFPDVSHDFKSVLYGNLGPTPVADYLIPIFDEWFREDDPEVVIRVFVEAIRVLHGASPGTDTLGKATQDYLIIDTDGSILANDALKVCYDGAPESSLNVLSHGFDDLEMGDPLLFRLVNEGMPLCETCLACPERETCGGGAVPHRYSRIRGFMNPSVWCADLLKFLGHVRSAISPFADPPEQTQLDSALSGIGEVPLPLE